eukprot:m.8349 g.8349  ORF g.8349 m.8349 type:complete len:293 (-) comp5433_c0_seq1:236-1114(-)
MSGSEQLNRERVYQVNVQGTQNIINACRECGVRSLVYISTYNVVFNGQTILNGDESLPYIDDNQHTDEYSRTKTQAEKLVLAANNEELKTCALRPAAIYGDGEYRHIPRLIRVVNQGLGFMAIGSSDVLCDWLYGDNLAHAIQLAVQALDKQDPNVAGEAFFISDDDPINNFEFLRRILGDRALFNVAFPTPVMKMVGILTEKVHALLSPILPFEPFLTLAEVCKVGVTHYASIAKAKKRLGYTPCVSAETGIQRTRAWCRPQIDRRWKRRVMLNLVATLAVVLFLLLFLVR